MDTAADMVSINDVSVQGEKHSDTKDKWNSLEHNGVTFFPKYQPHNVGFVFKGRQIKLEPEVEEICSWWATIEESDFALKDTVKKNFEKCLLPLLDKKLKVKSLEELDFKPIRDVLEKQREIKNSRSTEEKKKDA